MRAVLPVLILLCLPAMAAPSLPPGKPAGVHAAQSHTEGSYILLGAAAVAIAVGAAFFDFGTSATSTGSSQ